MWKIAGGLPQWSDGLVLVCATETGQPVKDGGQPEVQHKYWVVSHSRSCGIFERDLTAQMGGEKDLTDPPLVRVLVYVPVAAIWA